MRRLRLLAVPLLVGLFGVALSACFPPAYEDFSPGLWRTPGGPSCYWERVRADGSIIDNSFSHGGPRYTAIGASDAGFHTSGCLTFWRDTPPDEHAHTLATPGQPFGAGDFKVGPEVQPGVYWAAGAQDGAGCYWARLNGWDGSVSNIIANVFQPFPGALELRIGTTDVGFTSDGCGVWYRIGD